MAKLAIHLSGQFQVTLGSKVVSGFSTNKARALLAYLAVEADRVHSRQTLAGLLWPEYPDHLALTSLRSALVNLRSVLSDRNTEQPFLHISRQSVQFNQSSDTWVDMTVLSGMLHASTIQQASSAQLEEAIGLYRGDFLNGFSLPDSIAFEEWALVKREQYKRDMMRVLHQLTAIYEGQANYTKAIQFARQQVSLDAWQERGQRQLIRLLALSGRRSAALAQYEKIKRVLQEELGVEPSRETRKLYEQVRDETLAVPKLDANSIASHFPLPEFLEEDAYRMVEIPVFVAREKVIGQLEGHLEQALHGSGHAVLVLGEAGRGKTSLLRAFSQQVQETHADVLVVTGLCNAQSGVGDPYLPFRQCLEMLCGDVEGRWKAGSITSVQARQLWGLLPQTAERISADGLGLIDTLVYGEGLVRRLKSAGLRNGDWLQRLERQVEMRSRLQDTVSLNKVDLFEQYTRLILGLSQEKPIVMLLDDLHWADPGSIGLLFHLSRQLDRGRILLVCAYRPEEMAVGDRLDVTREMRRQYGDIEIDLDSNDRTNGRRFVDALLDCESNRLGQEFRERVYAYTEGHPLFTLELVRMLEERGGIVQDEGGLWIEGDPAAWDGKPSRVEAVIEKRIGCLRPEVRQALAVASVEGEFFTAEVVARVQGLGELEWLGLLSREVAKVHRLVHEQEMVEGLSRYRFAHNLFQKYLYEELSQGEQKLLHREVAQAIEALYPPEAAVVLLAYHYSRAKARDKAVHYLTLAGQQAWKKYASQEAIGYYSEGMDLLPEMDFGRFELLAARARVYNLTAQREAQRRDIDLMLHLAEVQDDDILRCDARILLADFYLTTEPFKVREQGLKIIELAQSVGDPVREARALKLMASLAGRHVLHHQECVSYFKRAAEIFENAGLFLEAADCLLSLSDMTDGAFKHASGRSGSEQALIWSREAGDLRQEAVCLRLVAYEYLNQNQDIEAQTCIEEALRLHREIGDRTEECKTLLFLGNISVEKPELARDYLIESLHIADAVGMPNVMTLAADSLWKLWYFPRGDYQECLAFSDEYMHRQNSSGEILTYGFFNHLKSICLADLGLMKEARQQLASFFFSSKRNDDQISSGFGWLALGSSYLTV